MLLSWRKGEMVLGREKRPLRAAGGSLRLGAFPKHQSFLIHQLNWRCFLDPGTLLKEGDCHRDHSTPEPRSDFKPHVRPCPGLAANQGGYLAGLLPSQPGTCPLTGKAAALPLVPAA